MPSACGQAFVTRLLDGAGMVAVDVGARGDIPSPWLAFEAVAEFVCIEPDPESCEALRHVYESRGHGERYQIVEAAVTREGGPRTLNITGAPGGASLFDVDIALYREYLDSDYLFPVRTAEISTRPVAEVFREAGVTDPDLLKLDVQGSELDVLEGLGTDLLGRTVVVELEASMLRRDAGYPGFCEIHEFMLDSGFEMLDLWPDHAHRAKDGSRDNYLKKLLGVRRDSGSVAARIWEVDLLYFRPPDSLESASDIGKLRKLAVVLCAYGFFVEALYAVERMGESGIEPADSVEEMTSAVVEWHRLCRRRVWNKPGFLGDAAAYLLRALKVREFITPSDYIHKR